ncbi:uncharacterized [Tachysurus ichikawai]
MKHIVYLLRVFQVLLVFLGSMVEQVVQVYREIPGRPDPLDHRDRKVWKEVLEIRVSKAKTAQRGKWENQDSEDLKESLVSRVEQGFQEDLELKGLQGFPGIQGQDGFHGSPVSAEYDEESVVYKDAAVKVTK